ncbi:MAG: lytic transglycosylase domain-containing protein, partial [Cyanobacteriota bacterium]
LKKYQEYHNKIGNSARTKTTESEMKKISVELDKASKAFGVDSKIMLAVYAHESGGFNPRATSHTGAGGLGQLTGIAIRQVHYMAGMAKGQTGRSPYTEHKDDFIKSQTNLSQRHDISKNIWTSTAYMAYEINDRNNGNIKRSLERYGDPNVSTYENKVNSEYKILFGKSIF